MNTTKTFETYYAQVLDELLTITSPTFAALLMQDYELEIRLGFENSWTPTIVASNIFRLEDEAEG